MFTQSANMLFIFSYPAQLSTTSMGFLQQKEDPYLAPAK